MKPLDLVKTTLNGVISIAVGSVVGNLSEYFIPKNLRPLAKAGVSLATYMLTSAVTSKISNTVDNELDNEFNGKNELPQA